MTTTTTAAAGATADKYDKYVGYVRVSTKQQGHSGLGLESQRESVARFVASRGELVASYTEVESGRKDDRPQLARALAACRRYGAVLVVAKLDRLSRDAAFLLELRKAGTRFVCADLPEMNELTVGLFAVLAEHEARLISERTKAALAAAKARGQQLGGHPERLTPAAQRRGQRVSAARRAARASEHAAAFTDTIAELRAAGVSSLAGIARALEDRGVPTPAGKQRWHVTTVRRLLGRLEPLELRAAA